MADMKWAPGSGYGPVLTPTELYLLDAKLQIHPILTHSMKAFHLVFNLASGVTGGFNPDSTGNDLPFTKKDEMATCPRVSELIIITNLSPWCTIVKNPKGVSLGDVCGQLWKDYSEYNITEAEFGSIPPQHQERVRRMAMSRESGYWGHQAAPGGNRCKRIDWLRDRVFFDGLEHDDGLSMARLGFKAPNILVMSLTQ